MLEKKVKKNGKVEQAYRVNWKKQEQGNRAEEHDSCAVFIFTMSTEWNKIVSLGEDKSWMEYVRTRTYMHM